MELEVLARQVSATSVHGCQYDYTAVNNCIYGVNNYPTCYNYYSDKSCCSNWLNWEYSYLNCLQTAYKNCYDFQGYASQVSAFLPCYTDSPLSAPASAAAQTTTASVPGLVLQSVSTAGPTTRPPHDPLPSYSGTGGLLKGYCSTPDFVLLDQGPTAYWAPVIGCINDKSDCCPYATAQKTTTGPTPTTITVVSTVTVDVGPGAATTKPPLVGNNAYPVPLSANEATLARCPDDYEVVSGACCPSGYSLWNAPLGGQVPCYSSLKSNISPPPVPVTPLSIPITTTRSGNVTLFTATSAKLSTQKPTSAIVNIVYAVQYAVQPAPAGLSTGAKAGVGVGVSLGSIAIIGLSVLLFLRTRRHKKEKAAFAAAQAAPPVSQAPASYPPQDQNGYFQPQQTQQGLAPGGYYVQKLPDQQVQEIPAHSPASYPSPSASTASPAPPSEGYQYQTGYIPQGQGPPTSYAPSSATSELPGQHGYQSQTVSSAGSPPPTEAFGYAVPARKAVPERQELSGQSPQQAQPSQGFGGQQQQVQYQPPERQELSGHSGLGEMSA